MKRVHNFGPGPATLPVAVLEEASRGVLEIGGSGMSILEVSHRGKEYEAIHFDARDCLLAALGLDAAEYAALFLGGGASMQFAMLPMNLLGGGTADYVNTGEWSTKAIKEAKRFGTVNVAASSEDEKFSYIPKTLKLTPGAKYVHITTNNTIEGTEFAALPDAGDVPLIADASSDILGRAYDFGKLLHDLRRGAEEPGPGRGDGGGGAAQVAGGGQRRHGGHPLVQDLPQERFALQHASGLRDLHRGLVLKWVEAQGGVAALDKRNRARAGRIYEALDAYPDVYDPAVTKKEDRSWMNVTFRLRDAAKEKDFLAGAQAAGMDGLKGHRSVGGFRASIYNALPEDGISALVDHIQKFAKR